MLLWRYTRCEICVLGQARDEEHEATGFDLELGEVGAASWNAGVFAERVYVLVCV